MLKSKKGLYVLLPVVVFIWGAIIYQVVGAFDDNEPVISNTISIPLLEIKTKERKQFDLGTIDRDPFLGTIYRQKKSPPKNTKSIVKKEITWPSIVFKGLVSGKNTKNTIFLIAINGTDQLMKPGDVVSDIKLIKGSPTSIQLRHKGKVKKFEILN